MNDCGLFGYCDVKAKLTSLLYFSHEEAEDGAKETSKIADKWGEKYAFRVELSPLTEKHYINLEKR